MTDVKLSQLLDDIDPTFRKIIYGGTCARMLNEIYEFIKDEKLLCPKLCDIFNAFKMSFDNLKIVIIGQDPYHTPGVANGLAFSSLHTIQPSLTNIHKALVKSGLSDDRKLTNGDLTFWKDQGILLMNTSWTTIEHQAAAHAAIYKDYMKNVLNRLNAMSRKSGKKLIFMLWGKHASNIVSKDIKEKHIVMEWAHPTAMISSSNVKNFVYCDHFIKANDILRSDESSEIVWDFNTPVDQRMELITHMAEEEAKAEIETRSMANQEEQDIKFDDIVSPIVDDLTYDDTNTGGNCAILDVIINDEKESKEIYTPDEKSKHQYIEQQQLEYHFAGGLRTSVCFTDGSCNPNKRCPEAVAGYAVMFVQGPFADTKMYGNIDNKVVYASNIRAEGIAILRALQYADKYKKEWDKFVVVTDCQLWSNMIIKYMPNWDETQFDEGSNPDITKPLYALWGKLENKYNKDMCILTIRSHNKSGWKSYGDGTYERFCYDQNDYVDKLASYARTNLENDVHFIDKVEYAEE